MSFDGRQESLKQVQSGEHRLRLWACTTLVPVHRAGNTLNCSWPSGMAILCHWERSNPHDPQAVRVCTLDGTDLGFIPQHLTQRFIFDTTFGRVDRVVGPGPQAGGLLGCRVTPCIPAAAAVVSDQIWQLCPCLAHQVTHTCPETACAKSGIQLAASCVHATQNRTSCCACRTCQPLTPQQTFRQCNHAGRCACRQTCRSCGLQLSHPL